MLNHRAWKATTQSTWTLAAMILLALSGCEKEDIKAYKAPKDAPTPQLATDQGPITPAPPAVHVTWTSPSTWTPVKSEQAMRVATYHAGGDPGVEISLAAFPGDVGGPLANVNRWRNQVGLPPATDADLPTMLESSDVKGVKVSTLRIKGAQGQDMLAAMITPGDGQTWFVKALAAPAILDSIRDDFLAFTKTFQLSALPSAPGAPTKAATTPPPTSPARPSGSIEARLSQFTPPANWTKEASASGFVTAAFAASNSHGGARVTASNLAGDGGGVLKNINRWRGQVGLAPLDNPQQQPTSTLGNAILVDLADADHKTRMLVAFFASGEKTWFYKLSGSPESVDDERSAFEKFVRSTGLGEP